MKSIFFILSFFFCFSVANAQDTLAEAEPPKMATVKYTEKDIQVDSDTIASKTFSKNFKKKYTGPEFIYEQKAPERGFWDNIKQWIANFFSRIFSFNDTEKTVTITVIVFRVLAILIIISVIYLIVKTLINKEGQWIFGKNARKKNIQYSDIEKNIHLLDFEKLIKESVLSGEKRIAIRYYYLWLLKVMAQNQYIEWDIEKTNSDYLYELKNPAYKDDFTYLSYLYNYIWYGEFEIDETSFIKAENRFKKSIKTFSNE